MFVPGVLGNELAHNRCVGVNFFVGEREQMVGERLPGGQQHGRLAWVLAHAIEEGMQAGAEGGEAGFRFVAEHLRHEVYAGGWDVVAREDSRPFAAFDVWKF